MSGKTNFGDTLTNGIQDVSALLPLLGTEQCERHVGSALEKGFLYAAVTPLSIFGSLGVVKTAFATLLATITFPFCGGRWLNDAGFGTPGSVSSMVTIAEGGAEYGAEVKLMKLLEDQHIDDLDLVADVEWSSWRRSTDSQSVWCTSMTSLSWWMSMSWNMKLLLTSALAALVSICPYLYLISSDWTDPLFWFFPFLRAIGSFLCVVVTQLALQLRIHRIIRGRLQLMKATKHYHETNRLLGRVQLGDGTPKWDADKKDTLEQRLRKLSKFISRSDSEEGAVARGLVVATGDLTDTNSRVLIVYQLVMAIGIPMIIVGYVGCFNLVSQSIVIGGPYVWLGIEAILSVLRVALWGWNPEWDEGTGMKIKLKLSNDTPLITTPYRLQQLKIVKPQKSSFIICNENDFLATATRYTGPLQRFVSNTVSLFYSLVADDRGQSKHLLTTILDLHTRTTQTFDISVPGVLRVFSSTWKLDPCTNAMRVTLGAEIGRREIERRQDDVFNQVLDHSKQIASRLCGNGRIHALDLQWTVTYSSTKSDLGVSEIAMNDGDRIYARVGNQFINKSSFCRDRHDWIEHYMKKWKASWSPNEWAKLGQGIEVLHVLESAVLETYLHFKNDTAVQELAGTDANPSRTDRELAHRLSAEWLHEMECRMSKEKELPMKRLDEWKIHGNVKRRIIKLWSVWTEAYDYLARYGRWLDYVDHDLAKITKILDGGDIRELISTLDSGCWPSNSPTLDSQVKWFARRLKTVLQGGIPSRNSFARINFAEDPYLEVDDASGYVLNATRLNSSLRAIQLHDDLSTSDVNKILEIVAEKDTLTTLIGSKSTLSASILKNNRYILFLPGITCQPLCTEHPLCALVHRNWQEWRDSACSAGSDVTYTVGFASEGSISWIILYGDEIKLTRGVECLIMVYTHSNGRLKLSLHHRQNWELRLGDCSLHIFLRSGEIPSASKWKEVHSASAEDIPECYANKPCEIVTPELSAGYHEIRIQIQAEAFGDYYLHSATVTRCENDTDGRPEDV